VSSGIGQVRRLDQGGSAVDEDKATGRRTLDDACDQLPDDR
jgi:hypothetical protein